MACLAAERDGAVMMADDYGRAAAGPRLERLDNCRFRQSVHCIGGFVQDRISGSRSMARSASPAEAASCPWIMSLQIAQSSTEDQHKVPRTRGRSCGRPPIRAARRQLTGLFSTG